MDIPVDSLPFCSVLTDKNHNIISVNARFTEIFGWQPEEVVGKSVNILVPQESAEKHAKYLAEYAKDPVTKPLGIGRTLYAACKDGSVFPVEISLVLIGDGVLACVVDITVALAKTIADEMRVTLAKMNGIEHIDRTGAESRSTLVEAVRQPII